MAAKTTYAIEQAFDLLHPRARTAFEDLARYLDQQHAAGKCQSQFAPFETWRHPMRQIELLEKGVTKAPPWRSAHNYGMAVDFVPYTLDESGKKVWSWSELNDWAFLKKAAAKFGLSVPLPWDKAHVEHPLFDRLVKIGL